MGELSGQSCPICRRVVSTAATNKSRPFCSDRCKLVDLDRWLSGSYRVPGPPVESSGLGDVDRVGQDYETDRYDEPKGDD